MTTTPETSEPSEPTFSHLPTSTSATVAASSHAGALVALNTSSKYVQLIEEHTEMIRLGKSSREIISHLGKSLNIESWKNQKHHGLFMALSTPDEQEMDNLKGFLLELGLDPAFCVMGAKRPDFLLLDGRIPQALVGPQNMIQADALLERIHADWQALGDDFEGKEKYLKENFGLDIEGDWSKLIGIWNPKGWKEGGGGLGASGSFDGDKVLKLWLTKTGQRGGSIVTRDGDPAFGRMFLIGEVPTEK